MSNTKSEVKLRTGWEMKVLAVAAAVIAVCMVVALIMLPDVLGTIEALIKALDGASRSLDGVQS